MACERNDILENSGHAGAAREATQVDRASASDQRDAGPEQCATSRPPLDSETSRYRLFTYVVKSMATILQLKGEQEQSASARSPLDDKTTRRRLFTFVVNLVCASARQGDKSRQLESDLARKDRESQQLRDAFEHMEQREEALAYKRDRGLERTKDGLRRAVEEKRQLEAERDQWSDHFAWQCEEEDESTKQAVYLPTERMRKLEAERDYWRERCGEYKERVALAAAGLQDA